LRRWVVVDDQPFTVVERVEFIDMMKFACPSIQVPSADTLRRDISQDYKETKEKVRKELQVGYLIK
jgi:hypothetical protein